MTSRFHLTPGSRTPSYTYYFIYGNVGDATLYEHANVLRRQCQSIFVVDRPATITRALQDPEHIPKQPGEE